MGAGLRQNAFAQHMLNAALDVLQIGQKLENPSPPNPPDDERFGRLCGRGKLALSYTAVPSSRSEEAAFCGENGEIT